MYEICKIQPVSFLYKNISNYIIVACMPNKRCFLYEFQGKNVAFFKKAEFCTDQPLALSKRGLRHFDFSDILKSLKKYGLKLRITLELKGRGTVMELFAVSQNRQNYRSKIGLMGFTFFGLLVQHLLRVQKWTLQVLQHCNEFFKGISSSVVCLSWSGCIKCSVVIVLANNSA